MRIKLQWSAIGELTLGIAIILGCAFTAWSFRQRLIEWVGLNPDGLLFSLALVVAVLTVVDALANTVNKMATEQAGPQVSREIWVRHWILRIVFQMPVVVLTLLVALNIILLILALGLGKGTQAMTHPGDATAGTTTIFIGGIRLGEFRLNKTRAIRRESEHAYKYTVQSLGPFRARSDGPGFPTYAHTVVFENGIPMGPAHALHDTVRKEGKGAFSHWGGGWGNQSDIYFSSTDNTSPLENGRTYSIENSLNLNPLVTVLIVLLSLPMYVRCYIALAELRHKSPILKVLRRPTLLSSGVFCLGLGLFMFPLIAYWDTGKTTNTLIGGLLPWSDASGWLHGTYYFLNEHSLLWWTARRPINPAFMSFLAFVTGEDLQAMLVLRTLVTGLACLLVSSEVWRRFGAAAGITSFALLLSYSSPFTPTTLSESLGLAFGAAGFAMTWQAISRESVWRFAGGLFLLSLAMSVRPGPFLVIPFLALWGTFFMTGTQRNIIFRLFLTSSSIAAALIVSSLVSSVFGTGESYPGVNYAFTFYGLAFGGKPWAQFFDDFPQATSLSEAELGALAYRTAFNEILRNPSALFSGLWLFFKTYLNHLFIYIEYPILRPVSEFLAGCGLVVAAWRFRKDPHLSFLTCGALGVVLSAPFLFWAPDAYRAFIPTAPFEATAVSVGLATIANIPRYLLHSGSNSRALMGEWQHSQLSTITTTVMGGLLTFGATIGPVVAIAVHTTPRFAKTTCEGGLVPFVIQLGKSSPYIEIIEDGRAATQIPQIRYRDFHADDSFANVEISEALRGMQPGELLIHGYDLTHGSIINPTDLTGFKRFHWLIASKSQVPKTGRYYLLCGQTNRLPMQQQHFRVLFVESAREIARLKD